MKQVSQLQKVIIASATVVTLLVPSAVAFASDTPVKPTTTAPNEHSQFPAPRTTYSPAQVQVLQQAADAARATYVQDLAAFKQAQLNFAAVQQKYKNDFNTAKDNSTAGDNKPANPGDNKPTQSPAYVQAKQALTSAYVMLNTDRKTVSDLEKLSKANPTDATISGELAAARTKATASLNTYNTALLAFNILNAQPKSEPSAKPTGPAPLDPKVKAAQDLVIADYNALNTARSAVSKAEQASKASPTDATLSAALTAARAVATTANNTFLSDQQALKALLATTNGYHSATPTVAPAPTTTDGATVNTTPPPSDKNTNPSASREAATKAFIAAHPDYLVAYNALSDATKALQGAMKALSDAEQAFKKATNPTGIRPLPPVPAASPSTSPRA